MSNQDQLARDILSDVTIFMKYSKYRDDLGRRETWDELVDRNVAMHVKKYPMLEKEIYQVYDDYVRTKKVLPSMRSLQFAGPAIDKNPARIYNCSFLPVEHLDAFGETMFLLLGGTGVGVSVQQHHVAKLPPLLGPSKLEGKERPRRYLVGDSIEGWADAIKVLIESFFKGKKPVLFDFSDVRPKGHRLVTAGGKAPGAGPLRESLVQIINILERAISERGRGTFLRPIEAHDMICHIADSVLAGGIRRSALISLFSFDDADMLSCKFGNWWESNPQRGRANNSVVLDRSRIQEEEFFQLWNKVKASGSGEPGFYFTNDPDWGTNPCCLAGDSLISQGSKLIPLASLADGKVHDLMNWRGEMVKGTVWKTGAKQLYKISYTFTNSDVVMNLRATEDHKFMTFSGDTKTTLELTGETLMSFIKEPVTVVSIEKDSIEDVYDFNLSDDTHWGVVGGLVVHNCEIALRPYQMCNLCEVNASDVTSQEDLENRVRAGAFIGTLQAGFTEFHYLRDIWRKTVEKEALLGVSMTGIGSGAVMNLDLNKAGDVVKKENARVAGIIGINPAARTTAVKPAGTTSLVLGSSSGIHAWHNDYYVRRVRVGKNEAIYSYLKDNHPQLIEDDYFRPQDTSIICIPQKAPEGSMVRTESPLTILERVKKFSVEWVASGHSKGRNRHNVSCTISIKEDEWGDVGKWMWLNRDYYSGISVLPYDNGTYVQAPFTDCTKEEYEGLLPHLSAIDLTKVIETEDSTDLQGEIACAGGACNF